MNGGSGNEQESERLLAAAQGGDDSALWRLTNGLRPYLKAVVADLLDDRLEGKVNDSDVVQQAMLAAVERFGQFEGATLAEWQGWLVAIVRNETRNAARFWRQQRRQAQRELALEVGSAQAPALPGSAAPSRNLRRREEAAELMQAIEKLSPSDQQLIRWRNFDGLAHGVIAERLGISEAAVRQRWVAALDRLRIALEGKA